MGFREARLIPTYEVGKGFRTHCLRRRNTSSFSDDAPGLEVERTPLMHDVAKDCRAGRAELAFRLTALLLQVVRGDLQAL